MSLSSFFSRSRFEKMIHTFTERFPLPTLLVFIITGCLFFLIYTEREDWTVIRVIFSSIVTFFLSVGITLSLESGAKRHYALLFQVFAIVYGGIFYIFCDVSEYWFIDSLMVFFLHGIGFFAFLFFAPYIHDIFGKGENTIGYTNYFTRVAWTVLMSSIIGGALLLLGFIAITAIQELFGLRDIFSEGKPYAYWATIALALSAPLYALVELPYRQNIEENSYETNRFFSFLIRYVALPFIVIYFIILYAYSVKVLLNFNDWPKGTISWMVAGFSTFGYLIYIFAKPYEGENRFVVLFRKYFPYVVIPQLFMLAYAIGLRIAQYDITMNRYFVVVFGIWLFGISLYFILSGRRSLVVIPATLTLITLCISVGPWSAYSVPLDRQYVRLMSNLGQAGMVSQGGKILPAQKDIDPKLSNEIYEGIVYVCDFRQCEKIRALFPERMIELEKEQQEEWKKYNTDRPYNGLTPGTIVTAVTDSLGVKKSHKSDFIKQYLTFSMINTPWHTVFPLDIRGYDTILSIYEKSSMSYIDIPLDRVIVDSDVPEFSLSFSGNIVGPFSLEPFHEKLMKKYSSNNSGQLIAPNNTVNLDDMTYEVDIDEYHIKLIFENYFFPNPEFHDIKMPTLYGISGYALIRKK